MNKTNIKARLLNPYTTVPNHKIILDGVEQGEKEFLKEIERREISPNSSQVHSYEDVRSQAFILAIPSNNLNEIIFKAHLTYAVHLIDDYFDNPNLNLQPEELAKRRNDIYEILNAMPKVGNYANFLANKTKHPEAFYRGLQRLAYGGLIQLAKTPEEQDAYLGEYKKISLNTISDNVAKDIENVRNIPFWTTTKALYELWLSTELKCSPTLAELYNLVYGSAVYFHDLDIEREKGELNFFDRQEPTIEELTQMMSIAAKHIKNYENGRAPQRLQQVQFLKKAFA